MSVITAGVTSPTLVARQEIRTFWKDEALMELYILGLERFQKVDSNLPLSYYQIAGIHGRHRAYLALFEQALTKHVTDIANEFTGNDREKYVSAAQKFRIPYWDWAVNADLPDFVSQQDNVEVNSPTGKRTLPNPLFSYKLPSTRPGYAINRIPVAVTSNTVRHPTGPSLETDKKDLEGDLQSNRTAHWRRSVWNMLSAETTWQIFSNDGIVKGARAHQYSLEGVHNDIHVVVGEGGHMNHPEYAAFDPVFWLHHCNIDRLFALWQAIHKDAYFADSAPNNVPGQGINAPLRPFRKTANEFWTPGGVLYYLMTRLLTPDSQLLQRDTRTFHYTYPELEQWSSLNTQQKSDRLWSQVNDMYTKGTSAQNLVEFFKNPGARPVVGRPVVASARRVAPTAQQTMQAPAQDVSSQSTATVANPVIHMESAEHEAIEKSPPQDMRSFVDWSANIVVEKYAAKLSFVVYVFLGDFNENPKQWNRDPNLVGTYSIFASHIETTGCGRCQEAAETHQLVGGTVPLTTALVQKIGHEKVNSSDASEVTAYLYKELHWRVKDATGTEIKREDVPGLKISVLHSPVTLPESITQAAVWGEGVKATSVTAGRPGGANEDDD
ncbi:Di-copper centre-containing protein [Serendipita vermifera]|nr:Di-copper centre-containing protein [Serendipita vermifera]